MQIEILENDRKSTVLSGDYKIVDGCFVNQEDSTRVFALSDLPQDIVVNIAGSKNFIHYVRKTDQLRIGCIVMYARDWLGQYAMGAPHGYSQQQVDEYTEYIRCIRDLSKLRYLNDSDK